MRICCLPVLLAWNSLSALGGECPGFDLPSSDYDKFTACYIHSEGGLNWLQASSACRDYSAHLAFAYDRRELAVIVRLKYDVTKRFYPDLSKEKAENLLLHLNARRRKGSGEVMATMNWNRYHESEVAATRTAPIPNYNKKVTGVWYNESTLTSPADASSPCAAHVTSERDVTSAFQPLTWVHCELARATFAVCRKGRNDRSCSFPLELLTSPQHRGRVGHLYLVDLTAGYLAAGYPVMLDMVVANQSELTAVIPSDWKISYGVAMVYSCSAGWYTDEDRRQPTRQYVCGVTGWMEEESSTCQFYEGCAEDTLNRGLAEQTCSGHGYCRSFSNATTGCTCIHGYDGERCDWKTDQCASNPCGPFGICHSLGSDYYCTCHGSYGTTTKSCDVPVSECTLLQPCANGGTCEEREVGFRCRCPLIVMTNGENVLLADGSHAKWTGTRCDIDPVDDCFSNPCAADSLCVDYVGHFTCYCQGVWTGKYCEELVVDAASVYGDGVSVVVGFSLFFIAFTVSCMVCTRSRKKEAKSGAYATEDMVVAKYRASVESEKEALMKFLDEDQRGAREAASAAISARPSAHSPPPPRPAAPSTSPSRAIDSGGPQSLAALSGSGPLPANTLNPLHLTVALGALMRSATHSSAIVASRRTTSSPRASAGRLPQQSSSGAAPEDPSGPAPLPKSARSSAVERAPTTKKKKPLASWKPEATKKLKAAPGQRALRRLPKVQGRR